MRSIGLFLFSLFFIVAPLYAAPQTPIESIKLEIKQIEGNPDLPNKTELVEIYRRAINWLNEENKAIVNAAQYQNAIDNYDDLVKTLQNQLEETKNSSAEVLNTLSISELEQKIIQVNSRLIELTHLQQKEQDSNRELGESLLQLPQLESETNKKLAEATRKLQETEAKGKTPVTQAIIKELNSEIAYHKAHINEFTIQQLSVPNRQSLSAIKISIIKAEHAKTEELLENYRSLLTQQRLQRKNEAAQLTKELKELNYELPDFITNELKRNQQLAEEENQQALRLDQLSQQQRKVAEDINSVRNTLNALLEQAQWLNMSTALGQIQRTQIARLPKAPKLQQLDYDLANLRVTQISIENDLKGLENFEQLFNRQLQLYDILRNRKLLLDVKNDSDIAKLSAEKQQILKEETQRVLDGQQVLLEEMSGQSVPQTTLFSDEQLKLFDQQLKARYELLKSLQSNSELLTRELTKLNVLNKQLYDVLQEVREAAHRHLFWIADVEPLSFSYPKDLLYALYEFVLTDSFQQLKLAFSEVFLSPDTVSLIFLALIFVIFGISSRRHYNAFLERASTKVGKATQDSFSLTLKTVLWSIVAALPIPILWAALSYGLKSAWQYPIAVAIGEGISATLPIMWMFMITASFAHTKGLFIVQLGWSASRVNRAMRYYKLGVWLVVPLIMAIITLNTYTDLLPSKSDFSGTLGRMFFFLLCATLFLMTASLKRAGVPLYLDKQGSSDNRINRLLWLFLRMTPVIAAIAAAFGYLTTARSLLMRLDASVIIWFSLLIVYHIIRRWMFIQRRRIEFDRAKQKRAERLAQRAKSNDEETSHSSSSSANSDSGIENEVTEINLDEISAQSLHLIRSVITMITLVSIVALWSEMHSAFSFLDNITLWDSTTSIQGIASTESITLKSVLIAGIVFILTAQFVRNLPALLELAILQHLSLAPGTGYAITTVTKYVLMIIGSLIAFSILGIEWSKLQWLIAALGVGLGFGLQEIFANFVSGLIILFEKPIRINDMVTIRNLTGTISKINTRATTMVDWDRKEIIMPNKAFITEQFINWSLSDSVSRIVLSVPAEVGVDPELVKTLLLQCASQCSLVIGNPQSDAYLVDIHQGIQIFELRAYASDMSHRMPVRDELNRLIVQAYKNNNLVMPFPPFQIKGNLNTRPLHGEINERPFKAGEL